MTKADLVDEISGRTKISKSETATIVDQLLNAISRALSEGKHIEIRGLGTFKVRSGAEVMVPAKLVPVFKASNELKGMVRGGD
jgi:nucleoid DNA-binding protein